MIAFVSYAGGNCEYRLFQDGDGVRVEHWHLDTSDGPNSGNMIQDDSTAPETFSNTLRAMIYVSVNIAP